MPIASHGSCIPYLPIEIETVVLRLAATDLQAALALTATTRRTRAISGPTAYHTIAITSVTSASSLFQYVRTRHGAEFGKWVRQVVVSVRCGGRAAEVVAAIPRAMPRVLNVGCVGSDLIGFDTQERPYRRTRALDESTLFPCDIIAVGFGLGDPRYNPLWQQTTSRATKFHAVVRSIETPTFLYPSDAVTHYGVELDFEPYTNAKGLRAFRVYLTNILRRPSLRTLVVRPWHVIKKAGVLACLLKANDDRIHIAYDKFRAADGRYEWARAMKWTEGAIPLHEALDADELTSHGILAASSVPWPGWAMSAGGKAPRKQLASNSRRR